MSIPLRVLIAEDSQEDTELVVRALGHAGYDVAYERVDSADAMRGALDRSPWDLVLGDYSMPGFSGTAALAVVRERDPDVPFIFVSGTIGEDIAVEAMRAGAQDYVIKGNLRRLIPAIERELRDAEVRRERRRAEGTLRWLTLAVDQSPAAVFITDPSGTIEYVNRRFTEVTGYTRDEAIGQNPRILKSGLTRPEYYAKLWATILQGETWRAEIQNRRKNGDPYWGAVVISPIRDASGTIIHFLAIQEDITERRSLEAQFRQAQKMEAVGRLAGGVAHDFNNLLTVITSYADLLLEDLPPDLTQREDVVGIRQAAHKAAALTRQLLAFSRQQVLAPRVLDLNELVQGIEKMLHRLLGEDVEVAAALAPDVGAVKADPGQLEQVILNLAVNARDAMPAGGKLTIETGNAEITDPQARELTTVPAGRYVLLAVSDTGIGMDEETKSRIFEPFFTTKAPGKGTGLGLATVYGIVKQSGGFIWAYSEPGRGTTFKIYLPHADAPAEPRGGAGTASEAPRGTETVLLVEDAPAVRAVARQTLERRGYRVLEAPHGEAALRLAAGHHGPIHLLLTDVVMPELGGQQLAERLAALRPDLKVLFTSGYSDEAVVRHGEIQPGAGYLQKPFTPDGLARKVREVLDGS